MRLVFPVLLAALLIPLQAAPKKSKPKPKAVTQTVAQLQDKVKRLQQERDDMKEKLTSFEGLQQEIAAAQRSRDLAREEADKAKRDLALIRSSLNENQNSGDALIQDLQKTKGEVATLRSENERLQKDLNLTSAKLVGQVGEGALVTITPDITPAKAVNLRKVTPKARKVDRGVVVVNVLISETGEVLDAKLLQGLPGEGEWVQKANEACIDAAKRLLFDPARAADGKTRVRVWQGVGFLLD